MKTDVIRLSFSSTSIPNTKAKEVQLLNTILIITLKIQLGTYWSADIEFIDLSTLEEVHDAIQRAVDFDDDHLYEFFVARNERSRTRTSYDDENGGIYHTRIRDVFPLPSKMQLFYLFDYGDNWVFRIAPTRKKLHEPVSGIDYPKVVKESGETPVQYELEDGEFWVTGFGESVRA